MNDRSAPQNSLEQPPASYAGRTRFTQLEYDAVLANASIGIAFTRDRKFFLCNPKFAEMLGWRAEDLIGQPGDVVYPSSQSYEALGRIAVPVLTAGKQIDLDWEVRRKDGSTFLARIIAKAISSADPTRGTVWIVEDVTEQRRAGAELERLLAEQKLIVDNATIGIAFLRQRSIQRCNWRLEEMLGYVPGELDGRSTGIMHVSPEAFEEVGRIGYEAMSRGEAYSEERQLRRKDGTTIWCKVIGRAIDAARPHDGSIWIYDDISAERAQREGLERIVTERTAELREAQERAQHLADHDALTGLPNRRLLEDRLTQALALSQRNRKQTAVMFVDLDRFKSINDSLGHAVGDAVLKEVAQRLVKQLRVGDTVCRVGGDEFVVVLPESKRSTDAANVAAKIIETLSVPVLAADRELSVTPSIGIAVFPEDGRDAAMLIRNADAAMYHAKESGRANYQFFTEQMNQAAARRLALESDLRQAVQKGELVVQYQPIARLGDGAVVAHEALLRWQHAKQGRVAPLEFIQVAEDTGLILGIGEWVLHEACRWGTFIGAEHGVLVAVNLSARQFNDPKLIEVVRRVLAETGLPPQLLALEVAEATALQQPEVTASTLKKLKELGVSLALDDFGSGATSLAAVSRFVLDRVKLDRSLLDTTSDGRALLAGLVGFAHALGLQVVAKGVETPAEREALVALGCDCAQGFLIGPPADAERAADSYL